MMKLNFWPLWYRDKIEKRNYLKFKICVGILVIGISINIFSLIKCKETTYKNMEIIKNNTKIQRNKVIKEEKSIKNKMSTIGKYSYFITNVDKKVCFDSLNIEDEKTYLEVEKNCENLNEVNKILDIIEKDKKCKIIDMDIKKTNEDKFLIEFKLEENL